jgi:hypothetical protein
MGVWCILTLVGLRRIGWHEGVSSLGLLKSTILGQWHNRYTSPQELRHCEPSSLASKSRVLTDMRRNNTRTVRKHLHRRRIRQPTVCLINDGEFSFGGHLDETDLPLPILTTGGVHEVAVNSASIRSPRPQRVKDARMPSHPVWRERRIDLVDEFHSVCPLIKQGGSDERDIDHAEH